MIPGGGERMRMKRSVGGPMDIEQPRMSAGPLDIGPVKKAEPSTPPNLRESETEEHSCGDCRHFTGAACAKYRNYPVEEGQVCDSFEAAGEESSEMTDSGADPGGYE